MNHRSWKSRWGVAGILAALATTTLILVTLARTEAYGQIPDAGAQRRELIQEIARTNEILSEIRESLHRIEQQVAGGTAQVRPAGADNKKESPKRGTTSP